MVSRVLLTGAWSKAEAIPKLAKGYSPHPEFLIVEEGRVALVCLKSNEYTDVEGRVLSLYKNYVLKNPASPTYSTEEIARGVGEFNPEITYSL